MTTTTNSATIPPLERGLNILAMLAQGQTKSFSEILTELDAPKASVARLLKSLLATEHLQKTESGQYTLGPAMSVFATPSNLSDQLITAATPLIKELRDETGNSVLLSHWDGKTMTAITKVVHPGSVSMRHIGHTSTDLSDCPWTWLCYHYLTTRDKKLAEKTMANKAAFKKEYKDIAANIKAHGFAFDDQKVMRNVRRIAVTIRDKQQRIVGTLAIGGNPLTINNQQIIPFGQALQKAAKEIEQRMGWH